MFLCVCVCVAVGEREIETANEAARVGGGVWARVREREKRQYKEKLEICQS